MPSDAGPAKKPSVAKRLELAFEALLFGSRWLTAPVYVCLVVLLALLVVIFVEHIVDLVPHLLSAKSENEIVVLALKLIDLALVINLVIIIMMAGFENFVSRMNLIDHEDRPEWLGKIDFGEMKLKVIGSIIAISGIFMLEDFLNIEQQSRELTLLQLAIFMAFVVAGLLMAWTEKLSDRH
jgi:uncharacterized protein (TIGR00645 family)